jgi:hypothetical protein
MDPLPTLRTGHLRPEHGFIHPIDRVAGDVLGEIRDIKGDALLGTGTPLD